ncbi:MAG: Transcriptional regulator, TetR family [Acidobacteriaceae bacterium]|nr:Transcriptional regulator, TetR family [Acidobacteriaceae bacterium]
MKSGTKSKPEDLQKPANRGELVGRCLAAFIGAGTLDLSLDQLSGVVGVSKRMLVHYFGDRENLEEQAMSLLEKGLRAQFSSGSLPAGLTPMAAVMALWEQTTAPKSRGVLLLTMDLCRRAWNGSERARSFYDEQQRLWTDLLLNFLPSAEAANDFLQIFQGAALVYLVTGESNPGRSALQRWVSRQAK